MGNIGEAQFLQRLNLLGADLGSLSQPPATQPHLNLFSIRFVLHVPLSPRTQLLVTDTISEGVVLNDGGFTAMNRK
jgi:hypothetical protein